MKPLEIGFVVPEWTDARTRVRIDALERQGARVHIAGFRRIGFYVGRDMNHSITHLGAISQKRYFSRLIKYAAAIGKIRAIAKECDAIYTFGVDLALLAWFALLTRSCKATLILEIQDVRDVLLRGRISSRIFRIIDRFLAKRIDMMVVTSPLYISEYYYKILKSYPCKSMLIENKVFEYESDKFSLKKNEYSIQKSYLTVGYFGVIRCQKSLDFMLRCAASAEGRIRFYIRGIFLDIEDSTIEAIALNEYCTYAGEFVAPDELNEIYSRVDMVWACYPESSSTVGNWLWARTNRFYEACYFGKPIIALAGSADGIVVKEKNIGICVTPTKTETTAASLMQINRDTLDQWKANIQNLPKSTYTDGDQHKLLYEELCRLSF